MWESRALLYILIFFSGINIAFGANIHGTVYDFSLNKANNARVEINTSTNQVYIAQNGTYSFDVHEGVYSIGAVLAQKNTIIASVTENVTVRGNGAYNLDLILFPELSIGDFEENSRINEGIFDPIPNSRIKPLFTFILFAAIALAVAFWISIKKSKKSQLKNYDEKNGKIIQDTRHDFEKNDLQNLIGIIRKEGGRATQKDIRNQIPLSEAKISLMIAELEHKGVVEKIKKGRGNIIILK
jgi:uncharacterized membrane protein